MYGIKNKHCPLMNYILHALHVLNSKGTNSICFNAIKLSYIFSSFIRPQYDALSRAITRILWEDNLMRSPDSMYQEDVNKCNFSCPSSYNNTNVGLERCQQNTCS